MLGELMDWLLNLDRDFAFLLALPFVVAMAGLLAEWVRNRKKADNPRAYRREGLVHERHLWSRGL